MNKFMLINENDVISTFTDLSEAKETALQVAKETGKNILIAEIKLIAKTRVVLEEVDSLETDPIGSEKVKDSIPETKVLLEKEPSKDLKTDPIEKIETENKPTFDFEAFKNKLESDLQNVSSLVEHNKITDSYKKEFDLLDQEQTKIIRKIRKETCEKAGLKDLSIELSGKIDNDKDLISILNRYPSHYKENKNISEILKDIRNRFKPSLSLESIDEPIEKVEKESKVFNPKDFEEDIRNKFSELKIYNQSRLEECRDLLLSEYEQDENFRAMKSIIYTAYYEKLANMGKSGVKYISNAGNV